MHFYLDTIDGLDQFNFTLHGEFMKLINHNVEGAVKGLVVDKARKDYMNYDALKTTLGIGLEEMKMSMKFK